jgi:hypothetical protein
MYLEEPVSYLPRRPNVPVKDVAKRLPPRTNSINSHLGTIKESSKEVIHPQNSVLICRDPSRLTAPHQYHPRRRPRAAMDQSAGNLAFRYSRIFLAISSIRRHRHLPLEWRFTFLPRKRLTKRNRHSSSLTSQARAKSYTG